MRIPMYSVMGGASLGCSLRIKGTGVPGRVIVKILHCNYNYVLISVQIIMELKLYDKILILIIKPTHYTKL